MHTGSERGRLRRRKTRTPRVDRHLALAYSGGRDPFEDAASGTSRPRGGAGDNSNVRTSGSLVDRNAWAQQRYSWARQSRVFSVLPRDVLCDQLLAFLDATSLGRFGRTCRAALGASDQPLLWARLLQHDFDVPLRCFTTQGMPHAAVGRSCDSHAVRRLHARADYAQRVQRYHAQEQLLARERAAKQADRERGAHRQRIKQFWVFALLPAAWAGKVDDDEARLVGVGSRVCVLLATLLLAVLFPAFGLGLVEMLWSGTTGWLRVLVRCAFDAVTVVVGGCAAITSLRNEIFGLPAVRNVLGGAFDERRALKTRAAFAGILAANVALQVCSSLSVVVSVLCTVLLLLLPLLRFLLPIASVACIAFGVAAPHVPSRAHRVMMCVVPAVAALANEVWCRWTGQLYPWRLWVVLMWFVRAALAVSICYFCALSVAMLVERCRSGRRHWSPAPLVILVAVSVGWWLIELLHALYWLGAVWELGGWVVLCGFVHVLRVASWCLAGVVVPWCVASQLPGLPWSPAGQREATPAWLFGTGAALLACTVHGAARLMDLTADDALAVFAH